MEIILNDIYLILKKTTKKEEDILKKNFTLNDESDAYRSGRFDPKKIKKVKFFHKIKDSLVFFSGIAKEVIEFIKENNMSVSSFEDKREKFKHQTKEYNYRDFFNPKFDYVEHQIRALKKLKESNNGIIKATTSSGKTEIIIGLMKITNLKTLILVNNSNLGIQTAKRIEDAGIKCGIITTGKNKIEKNMVVTIGSVYKVPDLNKFNVLIIDEVHRASAKRFQDFLIKTKIKLRYGFSATPEGNSDLNFMKIKQFMGPIRETIEAKELLDNDVIVKPKIEFIQIWCPRTLDWSSANLLAIVQNTERNKKILKIVQEYKEPTMILIKNIEHGKYLEDIIPDSVFVHGSVEVSEREKIIEDFENGKIKNIIASNIFNEGISINAIRVLIIASGGKSKIETVQKLGRALRKDKGKFEAKVFDFFDENNKFTERHSRQRAKTYLKNGFEIANPLIFD